MLVVIIMPVVQIVLFGFAISVEINNINFSVVAPFRTDAVRQGVDNLSASNFFTFKGYILQNEIDKVLRNGTSDAVVVFADDYDRKVGGGAYGSGGAVGSKSGAAVQVIFDASNPNIATAGIGYVRSVLQKDMKSGADMIETQLLYNPQMKSAYNFVPGIMGLVFILICAMMTAISIVREKEMGTMEVLLVSPIHPLRYILSKMIPYFCISCINLLNILLLARFALGIPIASLSGVICMSLIYIALSLALGLAISTMTRKQAIAMIISGMLLMLPVIMLSGMLFPVENMPGILQFVSLFIPARWYIIAIRKLMIEGLPFFAVLKEFGILFAMAAAFIGAALLMFNDKLERR